MYIIANVLDQKWPLGRDYSDPAALSCKTMQNTMIHVLIIFTNIKLYFIINSRRTTKEIVMREPTADEDRWLNTIFLPWVAEKFPNLPLNHETRTLTVTRRDDLMRVFRTLDWSRAEGKLCYVQPCRDFGTTKDGQFYARFVWAWFQIEMGRQWDGLIVEFRPASQTEMPHWGIYTRAHNSNEWFPALTPSNDNTTLTFYDNYGCFTSREQAMASELWKSLPGEPMGEGYYIEEWHAFPVIWTGS